MPQPPIFFRCRPILSLGILALLIVDRSVAQNISYASVPYGWSQVQSARHSAQRFQQIADSSDSPVSEIADRNARFAEQWADVAESYSQMTSRVDAASAKLISMTNDLDDVTSKLSEYGLTPTIGLLLRHKKEQLDSWQVHDSQTLLASRELARTRQEQLELELVHPDGSDPVAQTAQFLADANAEDSSTSARVESLLRQRHQWITSLGQAYHDYQQKLGELDAATNASAKLTTRYRKLIDRHITWIRSGDPVTLRDIGNLKGGIAALFDSRRSSDFGPTVDLKLRSGAVAAIGLLITVMLIFFARWRTKSWMLGIGQKKVMKESSAGARRLVVGLLTPLVAAALPAILFLVARWLGTGIVSESTLHASSGLYAASLIGLAIEIARHLFRKFGYIDKHVDVDLPGREGVAKFLTLIGFGFVLAAYTITVMGAIDHGMWRGSVARFGFIAAMFVLLLTAHLALRPTGGFLEPLIAKFGGRVIHRVRLLIYLAGIGFPIALIVLSILGYGFTANELITRATVTSIGAMITASVWPGVKFVSAHAWKMLTAVRSTSQPEDGFGSNKPQLEPGVLGEHFLELKHQLAFLCQCALVLAGIVCLGWLWIDIFPNVRMGNPVVWNVEDTVTQMTHDETGQTIAESVIQTTPITALHLLLAAGTLFVAFQLAKLLPALFDALVLQRVSFDEAMEHFSLVLGRCLLFGVGCFIACRWVGIRWQAIQWLAVGLTIGLGFGLQDMVRNLFGGLIVLFEKPARLGDLITVGGVTGRVAAQKLRTTVVSDDEGREVIIPNKNFVSEDVINWMGAGRLSVIPIEVAVTRDERPADVCRMLTELIIEQPDVLLTPAPQATLVCVGKRSQRIEVRAWIEDGQDANRFRDSLLTITRDLLKEKSLLTMNQPTQPPVRNAADDIMSDSYRPATSRTRRRTA